MLVVYLLGDGTSLKGSNPETTCGEKQTSGGWGDTQI